MALFDALDLLVAGCEKELGASQAPRTCPHPVNTCVLSSHSFPCSPSLGGRASAGHSRVAY